jgi:hypothetical protein
MTIDDIAALYEQRKTELAAAQKRLDEAHAALLPLIASRNEGSVTHNGSRYKVTVTYGVNRTVDQAALSSSWDAMPEGIRNVFPVKHGVDLKELRHWQNNNPAEYARYIAPLVTAKPSKPAVKVEAIENEAAQAA